MSKLSIIKTVFATVCTSCLLGSCDYLEYDENKNWTEELVWSEFSYIDRYLTAVYAQLPGTFNCVDGAFLDASTDNAEHLNQSCRITKFNMGTWDMFDTPNGNWSVNYDGIRLANTFIEHADTCTLYREEYDFAAKQENLRKLYRYRGEARFLKAFFYFELFKRYGEIPIVEEWTDQYTPTDYSRQPVTDVVELIAEVCNSALPFLPGKSDLTGNDYKNNLGRPFKGTAWALKSRAFLYAASELSNSNGTLDCYYDSCAANSAKLFGAGYKIIPNYEDLFLPNSTTMQDNAEVIWDCRASGSKNLESSNFPIGFYGGNGMTNPTQDLVDAYEMLDGTTFDWDDPNDVNRMYTYRDKRFAATILYNGAEMGGRRVECFEGGRDASNSYQNGTRTGYYLKKFIKTDTDLSGDAANSRHYWPIFRYAEVLLNYAEAMNEMYGPDLDPDGYGKTARIALNEVRQRAGLPVFAEGGLTQDEFREKVRNERRVELAFEDHRHWDLRRWKIDVNPLGRPIHGVRIIREDNGDGTFSDKYTPIEIEKRVFEDKMYLYPIPEGEILLQNSLPQNPGW